MATKYARQLDIIDIEKLNIPIHVIGAGGIGSWTTLLIAKMGCPQIYVYDDDIVEEHNIASQFFTEKQQGQLKVEALQKNVLQQTGIKIMTAPQNLEEKISRGLIIMAVDSIEERGRLANIYKDKDIYIIDGRMGGLQLEIHTCPSNYYPKTIVSPEEIDHEPCTAKSICFNCAVIGGLIANYVRLFIDGRIINGNIIIGFNNLELLKEKYD